MDREDMTGFRKWIVGVAENVGYTIIAGLLGGAATAVWARVRGLDVVQIAVLGLVAAVAVVWLFVAIRVLSKHRATEPPPLTRSEILEHYAVEQARKNEEEAKRHAASAQTEREQREAVERRKSELEVELAKKEKNIVTITNSFRDLAERAIKLYEDADKDRIRLRKKLQEANEVIIAIERVTSGHVAGLLIEPPSAEEMVRASREIIEKHQIRQLAPKLSALATTTKPAQ